MVAGQGTASRSQGVASAQGGQVQAPEAQARRADDRGHEAERQDRASPAGRQPGVLQVDVGDDGSADFSFARADVATIAVDARHGDDLVRIDESNGVFTDTIPTTIDGGDGNDTLAGGTGSETLLGGNGNDSIDGNRGNDVALMGTGDDTFVWDPGDGSDIVEGQDGTDTMLFNGANGRRARRPVGERKPPQVLPRPRQHHDGHRRRRAGRLQRPRRRRLVTVNDLTGTDVNERERRPRRHPRRWHRRRPGRPRRSSTGPTATTRSTSTETQVP